jgi:hypothetical protein
MSEPISERRVTERRTPPNCCVTCKHARSEHLEGTADCAMDHCVCVTFVPAPPRPAAKPVVARKKK